MIILDTHIWIWWVQEDPRLTEKHQAWLQQYEVDGLGVSIFSCWEVTKLAEKGRIILPCPVEQWLNLALTYPGVRLLDLSVPIVVESSNLPGFHKDPADQIIVATARILGCLLLTAGRAILSYSGVKTLG
jgi:PIN domain nuclease of toxin-antitoxin system